METSEILEILDLAGQILVGLITVGGTIFYISYNKRYTKEEIV